jgi:natural product precursor
MKTKKLNKKLTFSKSTIANLNSKELNDVQGGQFLPTWLTCNNTCRTCPLLPRRGLALGLDKKSFQ